MGMARRNKNRFYLTGHAGTPCGLVALGDIDMVDGVAMVPAHSGAQGPGRTRRNQHGAPPTHRRRFRRVRARVPLRLDHRR